jgi:hypothetical protein
MEALLKSINYKRFITGLAGLVVIVLSIYFKNIYIFSLGLFILLFAFNTLPPAIIFQKNDSVEMTIYHIKKLINNSKSYVYIFSNSVNPIIYNNEEVIYSIQAAIRRDVKIMIICNKNKFIEAHHCNEKIYNEKTMCHFIKNNSIFIYGLDKGEETDSYFKKVNHFIVVDGKSFRIEKSHEFENIVRIATIGNLGRRAKQLKDIFIELRDSSDCKQLKFNINN